MDCCKFSWLWDLLTSFSKFDFSSLRWNNSDRSFVTWCFIPNSSSSTLVFSSIVEKSSVSSLLVSSCTSLISFSSSVLLCLRFRSFSRLGDIDSFGFFSVSWPAKAPFLFPVLVDISISPLTPNFSLYDLFGLSVSSCAMLWFGSVGKCRLPSIISQACRRSISSITSRHASSVLSMITNRRQFSRTEFKFSEFAHKSTSVKPAREKPPWLWRVTFSFKWDSILSLMKAHMTCTKYIVNK